MRIALVTYALQLGGVETFLHNLGEQLRAWGHDIHFVETEQCGVWSEMTREFGFEVVSVVRRPMATRVKHAAEIARSLAGYDALLINDSPLAMAVLSTLPPWAVAIPILHSALPSMIFNATSNLGQWQRIVTVAPGLRNLLIHSGKASAEQLICIPNGVKTDSVEAIRDNTDRLLKIVYVGRLEQGQKNVLAIPRILDQARVGGAVFSLDVIGDGPDAAAFEKSLLQTGITFRLHGRLSREQTLNELDRADVLLMPSRYEGLPMTLLEAMERGVTPIVSRLGGSTDYVVEHGVNGVLVEPDDEQAFTEAVILLAKNRVILGQMSSRARETVRQSFSVETMAAAYLELIKACQKETSKHPPIRTGLIETLLLGEFARIPYILVRPLRKVLRMLHLKS